jgi:methylated-DNA-[protein]-cysteine S-methyltransferase
MDLFSDRFESPIGLILLITDGEALRALNFLDFESRMVRLLKLLRLPQPVREGLETLRIKRRLQAYFSGNLTSLADIPVRTEGKPFQSKVWTELRKIPPGTTITYGQLAQRIKQSTASRAVGLANGSNSIAIVVPCHRVIGSAGALTGYGGGLERKRWLLHHEATYA